MYSWGEADVCRSPVTRRGSRRVSGGGSMSVTRFLCRVGILEVLCGSALGRLRRSFEMRRGRELVMMSPRERSPEKATRHEDHM